MKHKEPFVKLSQGTNLEMSHKEHIFKFTKGMNLEINHKDPFSQVYKRY